MARLLTTNLAATTLQSSLGGNTTDTSVSLSTGTGALFPSLLYAGDYFSAAITDTTGNVELVKVTGRSGDSLTVVRGQQGTSVRAFASGSRFELRLTAADIGFMQGSYWSRESATPMRIDETSFSLPGDVTSIYIPNRALRAIQTSTAQGFVVSSTYDSGSGLTTVVVRLLTIDSGLAAVEYGQDPGSAPFYGSIAQTLANLVATTAAGTENALTATLADAPSTGLSDKMRVRIRAASMNSDAVTLDLTLGTTDTGAIAVRKGGLVPLVAGDIPGPGYEMDLQYNSAVPCWVLLNPYIGASSSSSAIGLINHAMLGGF